jgi:hypothetical protein
LFVNPKLSHTYANLSLKWLKGTFTLRKGSSKVLLVFNGHSAHLNNLDMLQFAEDNDKSHCTGIRITEPLVFHATEGPF